MFKVYIHVYVYVYVYRICMYMSMYMYLLCMCVYIYIYIYILNMCVCARLHARVNPCIRASMYICEQHVMYYVVCAQIHMHACAYLCLHVHQH